MSSVMQKFRTQVLALALLITTLVGPARSAEQVAIDKVLPAELVKGEGYKIAEQALVQGLLCKFTLSSDYGTYEVGSSELLRIRIEEVRVLSRVGKIEGLQEFGQSLKTNLTQIPVSFSKFFTAPVSSFKNVGHNIKERVVSVGRFFSGREKSTHEDSTFKEISIGAEKRAVAAELGVDVYSSNPQIQRTLNHIARVRKAGTMPIKIGSIFVPGAPMGLSFLELRRDINADLRLKSPSQLHAMNNKILMKLNTPDNLKDSFLDNPHFSPRHRTVICANLEALTDVKCREHYARYCASCLSEERALFIERQSNLLLHYHKRVEGLHRILYTDSVPLAVDLSNRLLAIVPADYCSDEAFERLKQALIDTAAEQGTQIVHLYVTGVISNEQKGILARQNIYFKENYTVLEKSQ